MWRTYVARADRDGRPETIRAYQPSITTDTLDGLGSVPGLAEPASVTTQDGRPIQVLARGVYRFPGGEIYRCNDRNAP